MVDELMDTGHYKDMWLLDSVSVNLFCSEDYS